MAAIVPPNDYLLLSLVTENAEGSGGQREEPSSLWREAKPTRGEHPQIVAMGEQDCLTLGLKRLSDDSIRTRANLRGGLTAWRTVTPDGPAGHLFANVSGPAPFIRAVIPFHKIVADFRLPCHAGEATRLERPGERAGEYPVKRPATEPISEHHGLHSTEFSQRDIGAASVLAVPSPFGFPVPDKDETQSALHHEDLLAQSPMRHAIPAVVSAADAGRGRMGALVVVIRWGAQCWYDDY